MKLMLSLRTKGLLLLTLSGLVALLSYQQLQQFSAQAEVRLAQQQAAEMMPILVLASDLEAGTMITAEHLLQRKYPPQFIQDHWLEPQDAAAVIGMRLTRFAERGEPLTVDQLLADGQRQFSHRLQANQFAVTTNVGIEQLHHGMLTPGDKVVLYSHASGPLGQPDFLQNIEVLALDHEQQSSDGVLATTMTFAMTGAQAVRFAGFSQGPFQVWLQHPQHPYVPLQLPPQTVIYQMGQQTGMMAL